MCFAYYSNQKSTSKDIGSQAHMISPEAILGSSNRLELLQTLAECLRLGLINSAVPAGAC